MKEIGNVVSDIEISDKKNIRFAGIGNISLTDRAKAILSGDENFISHPFFTDKKGLMNKVTRTGSHNILQKLYLQLLTFLWWFPLQAL